MDPILTRLVAIVGLGIAAQWLAWRLRLPSILLLLGIGILVGPVLGVLRPDQLFGPLLLPIVSLSVAVILFEGGLSLRLSELRQSGSVVVRLSTLGVATTWGLGAYAAREILQWDIRSSLVLAALFVVTGPTVVGPMLRHIRPRGQVGNILKWEGIVTDPIGAVLAVLLFETLILSASEHATRGALIMALRTVFMGGGVGLGGGFLMRFLLGRHLLPDYLHNPLSLMMVFLVFAGGEFVQEEAGLLSVTVMGMFLANQRRARIARLVEFKEDLQVLLISGLFILLAARLDPSTLREIGWREALFVIVLILVVRPLSVLVSSLGSGVAWRERLLMMCLAPRGIVSAALASVIGLELAEHGIPSAEKIVPVAFAVIIGTVIVYGIGAPLLARALGLSDADPQGFLILGAQPFARALAKALSARGCRVLLVDSNRRNIARARLDGLSTKPGNILEEHFEESLDLSGIGRFLALTPNDEVNALACQKLEELFGSGGVYQLTPSEESDDNPEFGGRRLFGEGIDFVSLERNHADGAVLKATRLSEAFDMESYRAMYGAHAMPLFRIDEEARVSVLVRDLKQMPGSGQQILSMVLPVEQVETTPA